VIDGQIETPEVRELQPDRDEDEIPRSGRHRRLYWHLVTQDRSAWNARARRSAPRRGVLTRNRRPPRASAYFPRGGRTGYDSGCTDRPRREEAGSLLEFARAHEEQLRTDELIATGTTGQRLVDETDLQGRTQGVRTARRGPDDRFGGRSGKLDGIVFLRDPLEPSHTSPITRRCCGSVTFATRRSRRTSPPQRSSSGRLEK